MGNAAIWYYPELGYGGEEIDLGGPLSMDPRPEHVAVGTPRPSLGGFTVPSSLGWREVVRTKLDGLSEAAFASELRSLRSLQAYLTSNRTCALSADIAKTWGAFTTREVLRGSSTIPVPTTNAYATLSASGALSSGDLVAIRAPYPHWRWEVHAVTGAPSSGSLTLSGSTLLHNYPKGSLVAWHRFFPSLVGSMSLRDRTNGAGVVWDVMFDFEVSEQPAKKAPLIEWALAPLGDSKSPGGKIDLGGKAPGKGAGTSILDGFNLGGGKKPFSRR